MLNSQFSSEGARIAICGAMREKVALSDQLEERLVEFAAKIIGMAGKLCNTFQGRHIAKQILRSGTAAAPNYAEARGAESRADWLRVIMRCSLLSPELIVAIIAENKELSRSLG